MTTRVLPRRALPYCLEAAAPVLGFAALTAAAARVTIDLPGVPAPLTLQVLAVLLAGLTLGWRRGAASQLAYVAAIAAGMPLDARAHGLAALLGPTGGYLLGFVAAAAVSGAIAGHGRSLALPAASALAGLAALYICGGVWLTASFGYDLASAWRLGVAPFLGVDLLKAAVAVGAVAAVRRAGWR